jgi:hypothetical protein
VRFRLSPCPPISAFVPLAVLLDVEVESGVLIATKLAIVGVSYELVAGLEEAKLVWVSSLGVSTSLLVPI